MESVDTLNQARNRQDVLKEIHVQKGVSKGTRKITNNFIFVYGYLSMSLLLPILSWSGFLQIDENRGVWFARSGSLVVLFTVVAEFQLFKIDSFTKPISEKGLTYQNMGVADQLHIRFSKYISIWKMIAAVLAVCGTVIWGYGDLIWKFFQ